MKQIKMVMDLITSLLPAFEGVTTRQIRALTESSQRMDHLVRVLSALLKGEAVMLNNQLIRSHAVSFAQLRLPFDLAKEIEAMWKECGFDTTEPYPFDFSVFLPVNAPNRMVVVPFTAEQVMTPYGAMEQMSWIPMSPCGAFWGLMYVANRVKSRKHGDYILPGATRVVNGEKQALRLRVLPHVRSAGWAPMNMAYHPGTTFLGEEKVFR